jgi:fatty-acyl-CoA synthase
MTSATTKYRTLNEAFLPVCTEWPQNGFVFQDQFGNEKDCRFPEVETETARRAAALQEAGLAKGDRVLLSVAEPEHFVLTFLAALRVGIVPVPVFTPHQPGSRDLWLQQVGAILRTSRAKALLVSPQLESLAVSLAMRASLTVPVLASDGLVAHGEAFWPQIEPGDLAFLQYTSGSTTAPRAVRITHESLMHNIDGIMKSGLMVDPARDKGISWLPLYHDMGLVGFVLGPLVWGIEVVFIPTMRFIRNPSVWLEAIHRHRGTISFAPNFAYALAARRAKPSANKDNWDLSCLRVLGCGAEPIQVSTIREFSKAFGQYGLSSQCIVPAYGLAESTLAVTMHRPGQPWASHRIDAAMFRELKIARDAEDDVTAIEHVSCGRPFPNHQIDIRNSSGESLSEGREGLIWIKGPSVAPGYFDAETGPGTFLSDGWLNTGDLGYVLEGALFVTGREKDLIIINGRNLHPQMIEWAVARVEGVREGHVVAFARQGEHCEELIVAAETRSVASPQMLASISVAVLQAAWVNPSEIICMKPGCLPRTSSGKLKRYQVRQMHSRNQLAGDMVWGSSPGGLEPTGVASA